MNECTEQNIFYQAADIEIISQYELQIDNSHLSADRLSFLIFHCSLFIYFGVYQIGEVTFGCRYQIPSNNRPDTSYRSAVRSCNPRCLFPSYPTGEKTDRSANRKRLPLLWRRTPRALPEV